MRKTATQPWVEDKFVQIERDLDVSYAKMAKGCGLRGMQVIGLEQLTENLHTAVKEQMEDGVTGFIEVVLNQKLGAPARRHAMKNPISVAGIDPADLRDQQPV